MIIAIHHTKGSFSERWINYCQERNIDYKLVNCYATDIISQLKDCDALLWHHNHCDYKDVLFAKQLIYALEHKGIKTFPDYKTCWHFDDKIGQKYLFESIGAPLVPTYVFYAKNEALEWIDTETFPKVFKLRNGAGSENVKIVKTKKDARKFVYRAFGKGFSIFDRVGYFKDRLNKFLSGRDTLFGVIKGFVRLFIVTEYAKFHSREKGYVYFQDYVANNLFDIRVIVIGEKAFAIKRMVRKGDFRASGSGNIIYDKENFSNNTILLAFQLAEKIQAQCAAFDFVYDSERNPMVIEVSYGFSTHGYDGCVGYWDKTLHFHESPFIPQYWMVEELLK